MTQIIPITYFNDSALDIYARLNENQLRHYYEPHGGIFIAESLNVIHRALDAGCVPISFLMEDKYIDTQGRSLIERCPELPFYTASLDVLEKLIGYKLTRGMLCAMHRPKLPDLLSLCENAKRIVILENVMNPTNVGAIFRSAAALGMDGVLLTSGCADPLYRRSIRVSMGTVFQIPWTIMPDEDVGIASLKQIGFKTAAMALCDDSRPVNDPEVCSEEKLAIIMGTEGDGLKDTTIADCDYVLKIPMAHGVDSLNVAAASAVAFYALTN